MNLLYKSNGIFSNNWFGINDKFIASFKSSKNIKKEIFQRFQCIQTWFSDLDDFDTISPAKKIALKAIGTNHFNPKYIGWSFKTLILLIIGEKKKIENDRWKVYYDSFLKQNVDNDWLKDKAFNKIDTLLSKNYIRKLLYPGIEDFYNLFKADKFMVTRNLERIAYRYCKVLPYKGYYHEVKDKGKVVEEFIKKHPKIKYYGSGGDSVEDEVAVDVLKYYYKKGTIEQPLCLYRADSPKKINLKFDIFVGKNRQGLVDFIKTGENNKY